jgi:hypothetical protein
MDAWLALKTPSSKNVLPMGLGIDQDDFKQILEATVEVLDELLL